jgi:hypothetical protein
MPRILKVEGLTHGVWVELTQEKVDEDNITITEEEMCNQIVDFLGQEELRAARFSLSNTSTKLRVDRFDAFRATVLK